MDTKLLQICYNMAILCGLLMLLQSVFIRLNGIVNFEILKLKHKNNQKKKHTGG